MNTNYAIWGGVLGGSKMIYFQWVWVAPMKMGKFFVGEDQTAQCHT